MHKIKSRVSLNILVEDLIVRQYNRLNIIVFYAFTREFIDSKESMKDEYLIGRWHIKPKKLES